jgi:hypothetical protein
MSQSSTHAARFDANDDAVVAYRAVSPWAVAGLLFGLFSIATLLSPSLWIVAVIGVPLNAWALWQIAARSPALIGRGAAVWGLLLSAMFAVYAPVEHYLYQRFLGAEAQRVAAAWFEAVRKQDPAAAHRLMIDPRLRVGPSARPADFYRANPKLGQALVKLAEQPVLRTLFALGPKIGARYIETAGIQNIEKMEDVQQIYAVTYGEGKEKTTFFLALSLQRLLLDDNKVDWTVTRIDGPVRPSGWGS